MEKIENREILIEQIPPNFLDGEVISEEFAVFKVPVEKTSEVVKEISKFQKMQNEVKHLKRVNKCKEDAAFNIILGYPISIEDLELQEKMKKSKIFPNFEKLILSLPVSIPPFKR